MRDTRDFLVTTAVTAGTVGLGAVAPITAEGVAAEAGGPAAAANAAEGAAATAASAPDEVAFGFDDLKEVFKQITPQAKHWEDLGLNPFNLQQFAKDLRAAMDNAKTIRFNLTGMNYLNSPGGVLKGDPRFNALGSTNWELRTIIDNTSLRDKTVFYRYGKVLSLEEVLALP